MRTFRTDDSYAVKIEILRVKIMWTKGEFSTGKKKHELLRARSFYRG